MRKSAKPESPNSLYFLKIYWAVESESRRWTIIDEREGFMVDSKSLSGRIIAHGHYSYTTRKKTAELLGWNEEREAVVLRVAWEYFPSYA